MASPSTSRKRPGRPRRGLAPLSQRVTVVVTVREKHAIAVVARARQVNQGRLFRLLSLPQIMAEYQQRQNRDGAYVVVRPPGDAVALPEGAVISAAR